MSKLEVDAIEPQSGTTLTLGASGDTITIPSGATLTNSGTATGFGKVLQVVQGVKTDTSTITGTTPASLGLSVSITPASASNKILITAMCNLASTSGTKAGIKLYRNSTSIIDGVLDPPRVNATAQFKSESTEENECVIIHYLDSPSTTSSTTYTIYGFNTSSNSIYMNRTEADANTSGSVRSASVITAIEIAG